MAGMENFYRERDRDRRAAAAESDSQSNEPAAQRPYGAGAGGAGANRPAAQYHYPQVAPPQYYESPNPQLQYPDGSDPAAYAAAGGRRRVDPSAAKAQFSSHQHHVVQSESPTSDKYAGLGFGITGLLTDYFVSHPFVVLRRTCQVNNASFRHHRTPFTLLPVVANLNRSQGLGCLWKGIGSTLIVRGMTLAAEDCTSKFTPWPKEIDRHSSLRMVGQHLLLKAVSLAVVTPFYSASLVETVQSEIASERPGILDVFREGFSRILNWSCPHSGRMLPVWMLMPSTVVHGVLHYMTFVVTSSLSHTMIVRAHRKNQRAKGAVAKESCMLPGLAQYQDQLASLIGHIAADALLYPLETIVHRLHMQGCRTIVDNLDTGREVMPILTRYEGFFDCLATVLEEEGAAGLFRGFGALILQYLVQFAVIKCSAAVVGEISRIVAQETVEAAPPPPPQLVQGNMRLPQNYRRPRRFESPPAEDSPQENSPQASRPPQQPQVSPSSASSHSSPAGQRGQSSSEWAETPLSRF